MDGNPTLYMFATTPQSILNPFNFMDTRCSPLNTITIATIMLHSWPVMVAMAAPATPSLGIPASPNIRIGSRTMFTIAPVRLHAIGAIMLPVD